MDSHTLRVLGYDDLKDILSRYASSELGRGVVRVLKPSADPARLAQSLEQLAEARSLHESGEPLPLRGLREIVEIIRRGHRQNRALDPAELLDILSMLEACERLRSHLGSRAGAAPRLAGLAARIPDLSEPTRRIDEAVEQPGTVRDRASPRLWDIRSRRRELEERIRTLMVELSQGMRYRAHLMERAYSIRNGRFVLPVKLEHRGHVPGILHDRSASGGTAFVEPEAAVVLTNELSDLRLDEDREVERILLDLSRPLYERQASLAYAQEVAAWLDFTAARAAMSLDLGLVPARLVPDPVLRLRDGRHPLLVDARRRNLLDHEVVPVSVTLGADHRILVITGPNTGGKTVALKTVGLIQLMFQSGLHVPAAAGTELPCLAAIGADIGDEQSLTQSLSTFSGHVRNIVQVLRSAGPRSLVLLDELGAGTDPTEGAALGQAILDKVLALGAIGMVTTHLGMLKAYAFSRPEVENACVAFDAETLRPTFHLVVGQPGTSQALVIAERHGLDPAVVAEARELVSGERGRAEELMDDLLASRVAAERARARSEDLVRDSESRLQAAEVALREAEGERRRVEREAESEVQRVLDGFVREARSHLNALKNVPKALLPDVQAVEALLAGRMRMMLFSERRREFLRDLKKHDPVYVPRFGQVCRIEKLNRAEERLTVRVGAVSMEIAFDDVSWVTPPA